MKQLYYTSCRAGMGLGRGPGQQVRATTDNVSTEQLHDIERIASYELPASMNIGIIPTKGTPIKLAYLNGLPSLGEHALVHAAHVPVDPASGRPSTRFVHLLFDLPRTCTVQDAIRTWKSEFWVTHDDEGPTSLPAQATMPIGNLLDESQLTEWIQSPEHLEDIAFIAHAWMLRDATQHVYLACSSDDAAYMIYGLTYLIPSPLQTTMTFSTYERYPEKSSAQIVATWWPDLEKSDLPMRCYNGMGYAVHTARRKRSTLQTHFRFIDHMLSLLRDGQYNELKELHQWFDRSTVHTPHDIQEAFDLRTNPQVVAVTPNRPKEPIATEPPPLSNRLDKRLRYELLTKMLQEKKNEEIERTLPTLLASIDEAIIFIGSQQGAPTHNEALKACTPIFERWIMTYTFAVANRAHDHAVLKWLVTYATDMSPQAKVRTKALYDLFQFCVHPNYVHRPLNQLNDTMQILKKEFPDTALTLTTELMCSTIPRTKMRISDLEHLISTVYKGIYPTPAEMLLNTTTWILRERPSLIYSRMGMLLLQECMVGPQTQYMIGKIAQVDTFPVVAQILTQWKKSDFETLQLAAAQEPPALQYMLTLLGQERNALLSLFSKVTQRIFRRTDN
jgi:GTPase-associated protein 1, N-terminal domain type 2/GTPase-associated protein 1, middle domain